MASLCYSVASLILWMVALLYFLARWGWPLWRVFGGLSVTVGFASTEWFTGGGCAYRCR